MTVKTTVVVGRKWKNPNIEIKVTVDEIKVEMSLEDFLGALALETGNPTFMVTVKGLEKRLQAASLKVVEGMKKETERAV